MKHKTQLFYIVILAMENHNKVNGLQTKQKNKIKSVLQ